jgi:hypothetical protein
MGRTTDLSEGGIHGGTAYIVANVNEPEQSPRSVKKDALAGNESDKWAPTEHVSEVCEQIPGGIGAPRSSRLVRQTAL